MAHIIFPSFFLNRLSDFIKIMRLQAYLPLVLCSALSLGEYRFFYSICCVRIVSNIDLIFGLKSRRQSYDHLFVLSIQKK